MATLSQGYTLPHNFREQLVETTRIRDIAPRWTNVHIAKSTETIASVFKTLIDNFILSVPLLDVTTQKYVAFIDIYDILAYIVEVLNLPLDQSEAWMVSSQFQNTSCIVLPNRSQRNPWFIISEDAPLQAAINMICQCNVHRLAVIDSFGRFSSVITQSRITRYIANRTMEIGDLGYKRIDELGIMSDFMVTVKDTDRLIDSFLTIYREGVSGVAVLNSQNRIVGNISLSDLKDIGFAAGMFRKMFIPNYEFINRKIEGQDLPKLVWTYGSSIFKDVLYKLRVNGVHRVYVVQEDMIPRGVITLTDILRLFNTSLA